MCLKIWTCIITYLILFPPTCPHNFHTQFSPYGKWLFQPADCRWNNPKGSTTSVGMRVAITWWVSFIGCLSAPNIQLEVMKRKVNFIVAQFSSVLSVAVKDGREIKVFMGVVISICPLWKKIHPERLKLIVKMTPWKTSIKYLWV